MMLFCLVVSLFTNAFSAPTVPLLVTVSSSSASVGEQAAAQWLASYLTNITSSPCPIKDPSAAKGQPQLAVGYEAATMLGVNPSVLAPLGLEGYVVLAGTGGGGVPQGSVALTGSAKAPRGALYAVNQFLEALGVRFVSEDSTFLPSQSSVPLPSINISSIPPLEYREVYGWQQQFDQNWSMHRRINHMLSGAVLDPAHGGQVVYATPPGFVHTSYTIVGGNLNTPPPALFNQHPEWFWPHDNPNVYGQLCWTNPELVQFVLQQVRQFLTQQPSATIISVSQNDNQNYCQDPAELAVIQEEGSPIGPLLRAVNTIASAIASDFPLVAIDTLAYQYTRPAPLKTKPLPNVIIRLCSIECNFAVPFTDPTNKAFQQDIVNWNQISKRLYVWDYITDFGCYMCPFPNWFAIGPNIQFLIQHGGKGIFEEGTYNGPGGDMSELKDYVISALMLNPNQNPDILIQSFLIYYYGPAALSILNYMNVVHDSAVDLGVYVGENFPVSAKFLTPTVVLSAAQAFMDARSSVPAESLYGEHVRRSSMSIYYVCLLRWSELNAFASSQGIPWPLEKDLNEAYNSFVIAYNETSKRYGKNPIFFEGGENVGLDWLFNQLFAPHPYCPRGLSPSIILPSSVAVSSQYTTPTVDGYWTAASYPVQWIEFTLPSGAVVGGVAARVNQVPNGQTTHVITIDGKQVAQWDGNTENQQILQWGADTAVAGSKLRITTTESPSWVAWSGITIAKCS